MSIQKVLLVEDEPLIQLTHLIMLKQLGCNVDAAKNGQKALEYAKKNKYNVILMDVGLPDTNGIAVTKKIRQTASFRSSKSFIVALTAYVKEELKDDCIAAGIDIIENKPISIERLKQILGREGSPSLN